jgi:hypothetical protein
VRIELLHIAECTNWEATSHLLRAALDALGHPDTPITVTLIDSPASAERVPFAGSPTILVDGADLFPSGERTSELACRIYLTSTGLAGHPTQEQITESLTARG